jgi:DNA/RNA-binding domain of Phe-tRNA-synthetase-like protein
VYFMHTPVIWERFPQLVPGLLLVEHIVPEADARPLVAPWLERARARLAQGNESDLPEVQAWRRAFGQLGVKPTQYRSAAEALLRRLRREHTLPPLHPLVDLCNAVSVAWALPVAALDLDRVQGFLEVRPAIGDEHYLAFDDTVEHPEPEEIVFVDAARQLHARRWTWRQSRRSMVGPTTRRALIVSEGLHAAAASDMPALLDALADGMERLGYLVAGRAVLTHTAARFDWDD